MPTFRYKALQSGGGIAEGDIEAGGRQEAFRLMEDKGLRPISLTEGRNGKAQKAPPKANKTAPKSAPEKAADKKSETAAAESKLSFGSKKVTSRELENFTRLLSSLLAAGVPLSRALLILVKEASSPVA